MFRAAAVLGALLWCRLAHVALGPSFAAVFFVSWALVLSFVWCCGAVCAVFIVSDAQQVKGSHNEAEGQGRVGLVVEGQGVDRNSKDMDIRPNLYARQVRPFVPLPH